MDNNKEYHDPDYPEASICVKEEPQKLSEDEKLIKIRHIICREFSSEIEARENEVMHIDQRLSTSRRLMHRLRYSIVSRYFGDQKLQITNSQIQDEVAAQKDPKARAEVSSILRDSQRPLHPSVRKLLGKQTVDMEEIFRTRGPRNKKRQDYSAMLKTRNYTISADSTKSLRPHTETSPPSPPPPAPAPPRKIPRQVDPKVTNVLTLDEATRNQMKHKYRIIIGNTSKYVPSSSGSDRSTHKWLLYVRAHGAAGPAHGAAGPVPAAVTVTLHHSYAPHHVVHLRKPPYQVSRRGWGEFPARVELHFPLPDRNKPATVDHHIKLDRNYTGMQMLGSETVVDVWLYSTPDMIPYSYKEEDAPTEQHIEQAQEPTQDKQTDWMDFFKSPTEMDIDEMLIKPDKKDDLTIENLPEIDAQKDVETPQNVTQVPTEIMAQTPSPKKRIVKYIDPTTGKIYYLEMDRQLDLTKVQEIVINNTSTKISPIHSNGLKNVKKKKVSLLKPVSKNEEIRNSLSHIQNDHCYLAIPKMQDNIARVDIKKEKCLYDCLCSNLYRFVDVKAAVNYLVRHMPLISDEARDPDFLKYFPYVVDNSDRYWKLDFAKRRNIEWSRAKLINKILSEHFTNGPIWRTKQILIYLRLHGHHPIRTELISKKNDPDYTSWTDFDNLDRDHTIRQTYPHASDINTLTPFKFDFDSSLNDTIELSDEDVDVLTCDVNVKVKKEPGIDNSRSLEVLPVEKEDDRMRFLYIEKKCADIGIELRNEDVGSGYSYSAVHAVLLSAMKSFAEELIRSALAKQRQHDPGAAASVWVGSSSPPSVGAAHVSQAASSARAAVTARAGLGRANRDARPV